MPQTETALYPLANIPPALQSPDYAPDELEDEGFLAQSIVDLWETRRCYEEEVEGDRRRMRHLDGTLGQMLFNLKGWDRIQAHRLGLDPVKVDDS